MVVLQRLVINNVNDRHHKCLGILLDSEKELVIYKQSPKTCEWCKESRAVLETWLKVVGASLRCIRSANRGRESPKSEFFL